MIADPLRTIITCHEASEGIATLELQQRGILATKVAAGILLCEGDQVFEKVSAAARAGDVIFARHIFPVNVEGTLDASIQKTAEAIMAGVSVAPAQTLSFQIRAFTAPDTFKKGDLAQELERLAQMRSIPIDRKYPQVVCSVVIVGSAVYAGTAATELCLSRWSGGEPRYRSEKDLVSRAENKLLEAFEVFPLLQPIDGAEALDLGASPGGWSKVLASFGYAVTAVDPAPLESSVLEDPRITYVQLSSQRFAATQRGSRFALIVNDMKMDAVESAHIVESISNLLSDDGAVVMTLKLPQLSPVKTFAKIREALTVLQQSYEIVGARQLFYNRSEVTVYLQLRRSKETISL